MTGQIARMTPERGFAFVAGQDGQSYFLHCSAVAEGVHFDDLTIDQMVEFEVEASARGPRAINLQPLATVSENQGVN